MKTIYKSAIILIFSYLFTCVVNSQTNDYPTKMLNGIEYYIYTVQPQEGLYSISKRFNTTQQVITDLNPEISEGLKNGQKILVPIISENNEIVKIKFIEHVVLKRQTLFSICKKYKVDLNIVKGLNPQLENGLKTGDTLKIPVLSMNKETIKKNSTTSISDKKISENKINPNYSIHKVKPKETLYSISKLYDITIEEIVQLNPDVKSKLKKGSEIKIPKNSISKNGENKSEINLTKKNGLNNENTQDKTKELENKLPIKIAFLLPLMLDQSTLESGNEKFKEFYVGSLIAINEAKKKGYSFEINLYDTEKSESKMAEVLLKTELMKMDFIIGPAFTNQVAMMSDFSRNNKINTLIPFTSKVYDIDVNPYLLQFNPGINIESKYIANILDTKYKNAQIVIVEQNEISNSNEENSYLPYLKSELNKLNRKFTIVKYTNADMINFTTVMRKNEKNIFFFNSDKISAISGHLSNLTGLSNEYDIRLYKQYGWLNNEEIKLNGFYISPFTSQLNYSLINKYQDLYDQFFNYSVTNISPRYDLLGYDLTKNFIDLLLKKGKNFTSDVYVLPESKGIQSQFNFERPTFKSGFVNQHLYFIEN